MEKIQLNIFGLHSSETTSGSFALVLEEARGKRHLQILIGMFEAQAIAIEIEGMTPNRPMTHDLFKSFANAFGYYIEEIIITNLKEGVFYSNIICSNGTDTYSIDARPSDALAIGLRFRVPKP